MSENYEFSFERSQLMKVVAGLLSLVILVFGAGLLTGVALQMREAAPALVAQSPHSQPVTAPAVAPAPIIVTPPPEPVVAPEDQPAVEASNDDAPAIDPDAPAVEDTSPASKVADAEDIGKFAVQFGAFLSRQNAGVLAKKLVTRGYDAGVVAREDSHGRTWYLVRYGVFTNRAEATAAALDLKARENLDALVRPSNSM
ncbi:MAG TPA: SPOR domain-containing protein [Terriglobia bacterium]|jgi:cell division protein FtsN